MEDTGTEERFIAAPAKTFIKRMQRKSMGQDHSKTGSRQKPRLGSRFFQPLVPALVGLLFAGLFFVSAMVDFHRLETMLLDALRSKAIYVLEVTHKACENKVRRLTTEGDELQNPLAGLLMEDDTAPLEVSLARSLLEVARTIDRNHADQNRLDLPHGFRGVGVLDEKGQLVYSGEPMPSRVLTHAKDLVEGGNEIDLHLFHGMNRQDYTGFVGIRRQSGQGAVLLTMDREDFMFWVWRTAIRSTVQEMSWGQGVVYLVVEDAEGNILGQSGNLPDEKLGECLLMARSAREGPNSLTGQCVKVGDTKFLELAVPFHLDGRPPGVARLGLETEETDRILSKNRQHILLWTGFMASVGLLAMGLLHRTQRRHISRLQAIQERLHQAEKLSALGKLGAGVAHEIRNPLNAISLAVQRLRREFRPVESEKQEPYEHITQVLRDEIQRLNGIVEEFLSLSRTSRLDLRPQSMAQLLERTLSLFQEEAEAKGVELRKRWASLDRPVRMDARKMQQALLNILRNALESTTTEGVVVVSCDEPGRNMTRIRIRDNGKGIDEGEERLIFDPFHTTKTNGTGLGLAIAHEIIAAHGGEIRVASRSGVGTTFEILLPQWDGE
jgi:signal transduction histidine kinase